MEHTLIAAYVVLLLGYLIMDNKVFFSFCLIFLISFYFSGPKS